MRRLFALLLVVCLWFGFAPSASADVAGLVPCNESPAFQQRLKNAKDQRAVERLQFYGKSNVVCGTDGLPHLVVDGRLDHAGEFLIPGILFLYIAGWIGWAGRSYIQAIKDDKDTEGKEIVIDVPLALQCSLAGATWPLGALKEFTTGELTAKDSEIPISPR